MRFAYEISQKFIGQSRIIKPLSIIAEEVKAGENINMLFEASSGYGKNYLAYLFLAFVDPTYSSSVQYIPERGKIPFDTSKRFHYIDEVHLLRPQEAIYPYLSSGEYTIILATNFFDGVQEAVVTRCNIFRFAPYTDDEQALLVQIYLEKHGVFLEFPLCKEIAKHCRGIPRVITNYAQRLAFIFRQIGTPTDPGEIDPIMDEYLGSEKGGYTEFDNQYLEALKLNGGTAGLDTLASLTGLPKKIIIEDIEPFLIRKERIIKTMKGRKLLK